MTGKPTALLRQLVEVAPPGEMIVDPFAGSSTTGVACLELGRRCILIEQSIEYCEITKQRLQGVKYGIPSRACSIGTRVSTAVNQMSGPKDESENVCVHRAAANNIDFKSGAARRSVCNTLLSAGNLGCHSID